MVKSGHHLFYGIIYTVRYGENSGQYLCYGTLWMEVLVGKAPKYIIMASCARHIHLVPECNEVQKLWGEKTFCGTCAIFIHFHVDSCGRRVVRITAFRGWCSLSFTRLKIIHKTKFWIKLKKDRSINWLLKYLI